MNAFQYPLRRLKQLHTLDLESAVNSFREIDAHLNMLIKQIDDRKMAITTAYQDLAARECKSRIILTNARQVTGLYVNALSAELQELDIRRKSVQVEHDVAHAVVLEKKKSVKMLEKHEVRLSERHALAARDRLHKEADELWLLHRVNA
jgi:negative regulator of genetic competence, sporulation and motility